MIDRIVEYSNKQMNQFYGRDLVEVHARILEEMDLGVLNTSDPVKTMVFTPRSLDDQATGQLRLSLAQILSEYEQEREQLLS